MFDFTVRDRGDHWVLQDVESGDIGRYETRDAALAAAGEWIRLINQAALASAGLRPRRRVA